MYPVKTKRIYELPSDDDGYRILVDRLWPRGVRKENACLDEWNKDIAPSATLRKWFGHEPTKFEEFSRKYKLELSGKQQEIQRLRRLARKTSLCLLYAAKDEVCNHAQVLADKIKNK